MSDRIQDTNTIDEDEALAAVGELYYRGIGIEKDFEQAFRYYRKAADMGNASALRRLASCYEQGLGTTPDMEAALLCYEDASEKGDALATLRLGDYYRNGLNPLITKDMLKATDYYLAALQQAKYNMDVWGAPDIYLRVGDCLLNGIGIQKDVEAAYNFYSAAANLYLERIDSGDGESEALLEEADQGMEKCNELLGYVEEISPEGFEA
ncbi:MAG: sel1 repeat family protein [Solobacterium sp.]|nr:sel1 repeat family protein [Solobacterium sp.]